MSDVDSRGGIPVAYLVDVYCKSMLIGKDWYHVHLDQLDNPIKADLCTHPKCSKSPNYQYEGAR